jgi:Holliday junction DNA helicase RuvA
VLALKILSGMNLDDLVPAVRGGDLARLTRIPGVGRKTAERIVVELRDKLAAMEPPGETQRPVTATGAAADVISALLNLGYERRAAEQAVERARKDGESGTFEILLRVTLRQLSAPAQKGAAVAR